MSLEKEDSKTSEAVVESLKLSGILAGDAWMFQPCFRYTEVFHRDTCQMLLLVP